MPPITIDISDKPQTPEENKKFTEGWTTPEIQEKQKFEKTYESWKRGGLVELEGKKLAELVGMIKKPLAKGYGKLFAEQSGEKNIFGGKGGWKFPLLNRIRGHVQAHRFEKALEKGDIKPFGLQGSVLYKQGGPFGVYGSGGEYSKKGWTPSRVDANMYLAIGRPLRDILVTLAHEGAHMEPMFGEQMVHGEILTQKSFKEKLGGSIGDYYDKSIAKAEKAFPAEDWGRKETMGEEGVQFYDKLSDIYMQRYDDPIEQNVNFPQFLAP